MSAAEQLLTNNLSTLALAVQKKSASGRGSSKKIDLYGIKKLRELILELAVRGKLVPQNPDDEPASKLLERIAAEKARLIKEKKIKKTRPLMGITSEDELFVLPDGWAFSRLGEITKQVTDGVHHTPRYLESGIPFISVKDIDGKRISFSDCKYISPEQHRDINSRCNPEKGDLLICRIGTLGRVTIVNTSQPFSIFVSVGLIKFFQADYLPEFSHLVLSSPFLTNQYDEIKAGGSHTNKLNLGDIPKLILPVCPISEQHRIVAKVDELMALCDQIEQQTEASLSAHTTLVENLLATLTSSANAEELEHNWQRIVSHFTTLFTTEASIDQLKQTILQLAVMGKLVPQDPNDEPAAKLLERIAAEKAQLVKEGKIKKQKPLPPIGEDDKSFVLPNGWSLVRLGNLTSKMGSGSTPRGGKSAYVDNGIPFLRSQNVWNDGLDLSDIAYITAETHAKMENTKVLPGDVLLNITGASLGRTIIFPADLKEANVSQHVTIIRLLESEMVTFVHTALLSPMVQSLVWGRQVGMAIEGLSKKVLECFEFPVPPLAEQKRIVAKVDQLMTLCDQIKTHLQHQQQTRLHLADAMVEKALS